MMNAFFKVGDAGMDLKWKGPFQYYRCNRSCPECGAVLVSAARLNWNFLKPLYHDMGTTCHCVACNIKYRAFGQVPFRKIAGNVSVLLLGGLMVAAWLLFGFWTSTIPRCLVLAGSFALLLYMPKIVFSVSENLWWQRTKLERIFAYEILDNY
jgi:hypothetical protein